MYFYSMNTVLFYMGVSKIEKNINSILLKSLLQLTFEPCHEIMVVFILRKLILQMRMRSHPVGLDICFLVGPYCQTSIVQTGKALVRLHECAGLPEPLLVAYVISTIISWAGSLDLFRKYSSVFRENRCPPPPKPVYGGNFSHEAVTLKIRSRSPKSNKLLILSNLFLVIFHPMVHEITCRQTLSGFSLVD